MQDDLWGEEARISLGGQAFNLDATLSCGQVFRWQRLPSCWEGVVDDQPVRIRQDGDELVFLGVDEKWVKRYFQLDLDLPAVYKEIDRDPVIRDAIVRCAGLRIVRQPAWECLASYLCATNTHIPRIRNCLRMLCETYGTPIGDGHGRFFTFPSPTTLAGAEGCDLEACRLGYRSAYLRDTARAIAGDPGWEERVTSMGYRDARAYLMQLKGIGPKVADCVLLFAFLKYEAFPVDVWVRRIMYTHYLQGDATRPLNAQEYDRIAGFAREYFGRYAGYAQEYLYAVRQR